jgi:DNA-binding transcriptional LysR family regulator
VGARSYPGDLPDLESLRCFLAAAHLLNFRKAARTVALTPAAFGSRIKQLEERFGRSLFARTTRTVTLTQAGLALLPHVTACLDAAVDCQRAARGETGFAPTELVLGTRQELGLSWVVPQIDVLEKVLPWLSLHLYFGAGPDLLLRVRTAEIDCAITSTRMSDPRLDALPIHREDYVFVGAPKLLARHPFTKPEHSKKHVLLDASQDMPLFRYFVDAVPDATFEFARIVRLGSIEAIKQRAVAGAGVAVLPLYHVRRELAQARLRRILPRIEASHDYFRLVFRAADPRRTAFEALGEAMRRVALR